MEAASNKDDAVELCEVCHQLASFPELPVIQIDGRCIHRACLPYRDWQQDVREFHRKFGVATKDKPGIPDPGTYILRRNIILEEMEEFLEALDDDDMVEIADGIADLIYVLLGTAISYGINIHPIWDEVQRTNMLKEGGATREDGKILKPEGWQPPDIKGILEAQGI